MAGILFLELRYPTKCFDVSYVYSVKECCAKRRLSVSNRRAIDNLLFLSVGGCSMTIPKFSLPCSLRYYDNKSLSVVSTIKFWVTKFILVHCSSCYRSLFVFANPKVVSLPSRPRSQAYLRGAQSMQPLCQNKRGEYKVLFICGQGGLV